MSQEETELLGRLMDDDFKSLLMDVDLSDVELGEETVPEVPETERESQEVGAAEVVVGGQAEQLSDNTGTEEAGSPGYSEPNRKSVNSEPETPVAKEHARLVVTVLSPPIAPKQTLTASATIAAAPITKLPGSEPGKLKVIS